MEFRVDSPDPKTYPSIVSVSLRKVGGGGGGVVIGWFRSDLGFIFD